MLGYVIALMVAWPIIGYAAIVLGAAYWTIRGMSIIGVDPVKLRDFVEMFGSKEDDLTETTLEDGWKIKVKPKSESNKKQLWINQWNNFICWPSSIRRLNRKGRAAIEHFKSET